MKMSSIDSGFSLVPHSSVCQQFPSIVGIVPVLIGHDTVLTL